MLLGNHEEGPPAAAVTLGLLELRSVVQAFQPGSMSDGSWGGAVPSERGMEAGSWRFILQGIACGGRV